MLISSDLSFPRSIAPAVNLAYASCSSISRACMPPHSSLGSLGRKGIL